MRDELHPQQDQATDADERLIHSVRRQVEEAEARSMPCPQRIGRYRILGVVGRGGMSIVYHGRQEKPSRAVAVKVTRPDTAGPKMLDRIENEAQILARLQHPGIAQLFDAGVADIGFGPQPYFVMELVSGSSLTAYADVHELTLRERLELLVKVCEAVQYAHQKGIVHRDLKPSNVLIDAHGQPKVLDFGVARVIDSDLERVTNHTEVGTLVGTIPYMSPEQVRGDLRRVDTRADVYALGVLGYHLAAHRFPYDVTQGSLTSVIRTICEAEPVPLSAVLRAARGDLETIFAKALEKELHRRYGSVADFAADVQHYLACEPITARLPTWTYQVRKFAFRHKGFVAGLLLAVLAVVAGSVGTMMGLVEAKRQAREARRQAYRAHITAAAAAVREDDPVRALTHLAGAPESVRGWEWDFLNRLADNSRVIYRSDPNTIVTLALSPDGKACAVADDEGTVRLGHIGPGGLKTLHVLDHESPVQALTFDRAGHCCACGTRAGIVALWDTRTGRRVARYRVNNDAITALSFSFDGARLGVGTANGTLMIANTKDGEPIKLGQQQGGIVALRFDSTSASLAACDEERYVAVWDVSRRERKTVHRWQHALFDVVFANETPYVIGMTGYRGVPILDGTTMTPFTTLQGHSGYIQAARFSADGSTVLTSARDCTIRAWRTDTGQSISVLTGHMTSADIIAFADEAGRVIGAIDGVEIRSWRLVPNSPITIFEGSSYAYPVLFDPNGRNIAAGFGDGTIRVWNLKDNALVHVLESPNMETITGLCWDSATGFLVSTTDHGVIRIWDVPTRTIVRTIYTPDTDIRDLACSPNGALAITGSAEGAVRFWDIGTGAQREVIETETGWINSVALSPDGSVLAAGADDGTIYLWGLDDGERRPGEQRVRHHAHAVQAVAFSSNGRRLVSCDLQGSIHLWDITSREIVQRMEVRTGAVYDVTFLPDDSRLLTASEDHTIRLWNPETGSLMAEFRDHDGYVYSIDVSPDGSMFVSGSGDHTVRVWRSRK